MNRVKTISWSPYAIDYTEQHLDWLNVNKKKYFKKEETRNGNLL